MTLILTFANGTTTTTNVAKSFTKKMISECFLNKDFKGMGIVANIEKSNVTVF